MLLFAFKIRHKCWLIGFSLVASLLVTLEVISVYLTNNLIDYRFYYHMNTDALDSDWLSLFEYATLYPILIAVLFFLLIYKGSKAIGKVLFSKNRYLIPSVLVALIVLSLSGGVLNEAYKLYEILNADEKSFDDALIDLGIHPDRYIDPTELKAIKGKNIVVISIESLEQGFLSSEFNNVAPYLSKLAEEWTFYKKMPQSPGGGWTVASLYNQQVGMPAFFKGKGNEVFQGTADVKLTGLGHILKTAGYDSRYLVGKKEFAGISDLLTAYGISTISEKNSIGVYLNKIEGLSDLDLFREAKLQLQSLEKGDAPFALFLSTINTHFPKGIYDRRMEDFIQERGSELEFSVSAVDYLINDFINHLKSKNLFDNTVIFIFPDHLLMGKTSVELEKLSRSKRQLYLITNAMDKVLDKKTSEVIYQIDLPRMIVNGAQIETNATFLTDLIQPSNTIDFLNSNTAKLTALNEASLTRVEYINFLNSQYIGLVGGVKGLRSELFEKIDEITVYVGSLLKNQKQLHKRTEAEDHFIAEIYSKDPTRFIAHAGGAIDGRKYTNSLEAMNSNYEKGFKLFELDIIKTSDGFYVAAHDWQHWQSVTGYKGRLPPTKKEFLEQEILNKYTPMGMALINGWFTEHPDAILVTDKINTPLDFSSKFIDKNRLMMELFSLEAVKEGLRSRIKSSMPSTNVINKIRGDKILFLKELGVTDIAISRRERHKQPENLKRMIDAGINAYAFHLHSDAEKDESYVVCNEYKYFYGVYADVWDFNATLDCSKH